MAIKFQFKMGRKITGTKPTKEQQEIINKFKQTVKYKRYDLTIVIQQSTAGALNKRDKYSITSGSMKFWKNKSKYQVTVWTGNCTYAPDAHLETLAHELGHVSQWINGENKGKTTHWIETDADNKAETFYKKRQMKSHTGRTRYSKQINKIW